MRAAIALSRTPALPPPVLVALPPTATPPRAHWMYVQCSAVESSTRTRHVKKEGNRGATACVPPPLPPPFPSASSRSRRDAVGLRFVAAVNGVWHVANAVRRCPLSATVAPCAAAVAAPPTGPTTRRSAVAAAATTQTPPLRRWRPRPLPPPRRQPRLCACPSPAGGHCRRWGGGGGLVSERVREDKRHPVTPQRGDSLGGCHGRRRPQQSVVVDIAFAVPGGGGWEGRHDGGVGSGLVGRRGGGRHPRRRLPPAPRGRGRADDREGGRHDHRRDHRPPPTWRRQWRPPALTPPTGAPLAPPSNDDGAVARPPPPSALPSPRRTVTAAASAASSTRHTAPRGVGRRRRG